MRKNNIYSETIFGEDDMYLMMAVYSRNMS
jgi:hypothetical protein